MVMIFFRGVFFYSESMPLSLLLHEMTHSTTENSNDKAVALMHI